MRDELFQPLAAILKESGAILRGEKGASRTTTLEWPDAKAIREKLGLSQTQFTSLVGVRPRLRRPSG